MPDISDAVRSPDLPIFPTGFRLLLPSAQVSPKTRETLTKRVAQLENLPAARFFTPDETATLTAVCETLLPSDGAAFAPAVAQTIDCRLADGDGDGWRYDLLPPDPQMYRQFLAGLHGDFIGLPLDARRARLAEMAKGDTNAAPSRFHEDMLAEIAEIFYSLPPVLDQIGYDGYADVLAEEAPIPRPLALIGMGEGESIPTILMTSSADEPFSPSPIPMRARGRGMGASSTDIVVIGTGAGGAPLLMRLAQAGFKIVALEAGREWVPSRDFATDEREQSKLFWKSERLSAGKDPLAFGSNNSGKGVGGSTLHYTAYTPRPHPDDFTVYSDFGVGANWPLSFADLEPYLEEVERFLGVSGPDLYPWGAPRRDRYPLGPLPLNAPARLMRTGCEPLGIATSPAPNAALSQPYFQEGVGWRAACTNRGFCQAGCSVGAKGSTDVTFIPVARAHGADVRPDCFVTEIERDKAGAVSGVLYVRDGVTERITCQAVFLCAGAIETPRLLLLNQMGNQSGQVGRNFMAHPGLQVWGQFEAETLPWRGIPGGLISEQFHRVPGANFAGGYLLQSIGVMPVTYASQHARGTCKSGDQMHDHMKGFRHVAGINLLGEGLPYAHNFVELSGEKDERGLPKPRIHFTRGQNEIALTEHARLVMRQIWDTAGARDVWEFNRFAHTLGTCRMGSDRTQSVVNRDGAVWDVPGLYICDNSVLPSSLTVNPGLTQMALSLRVADRFIARARRGEAGKLPTE